MNGYSLLSLVTCFGGLQGIVLVLAISRNRGPNREANRILSVLILLISLVLLGSLMNANDRALVRQYPHLVFFLDFPLMAFGPLIYLYTRSLLTGKPLKDGYGWRHFLPLGLHLIHLGRYFFESKSAILARLATKDFPMAPFVIVFATVQIGGYLIASYRLLRQFREAGAKEHSDQPALHYLAAFLLSMGACWLAWFLSGLVFLFPTVDTFQFLRPDIAWILMALTTAILAYFAMAERDSLALSIEPKKYEGSSLASTDLEKLSSRIADQMHQQEPHRQPRLSLSDLAQQLGIPARDLSRVINECHGMNFFDFVNQHRVATFKQLATPDRLAHETILALALEAGFNSKSTFNAAFKKHTGATPAKFLKTTPHPSTKASPPSPQAA